MTIFSLHGSAVQRSRGGSSASVEVAQSTEICFTGFKKEDKSRLIKLAEEAEMFVRPSVTKKLDFLCCGYNAGPKKVEKAHFQGVVALSDLQFMALLETSEIPEDA